MDKTTVYEMLGFVLAFLGIGIAYFAIHLGIRHDRYKRELEHKERMRALELGRSLPGDAAWLSPATLALMIAGGVPIGIFACASVATVQAGSDEARPRLLRTILPDKLTAITASQAITAALLARQRTGEGQHVRLSMLEAVLAFLWASDMSGQTFVGDEPARHPLRRASNMSSPVSAFSSCDQPPLVCI